MRAIDHPCVVNMIAVVFNEWRAESSAHVSCIVMNLACCSLYKLLYSTKDKIISDGIRPPNAYLTNGKSDRFCFALSFRLALLKDIASAIAYIHSLGILHRDIKPSNVLIDGHFRGKVCDFGLARVKKSASTLTSSTMQTTVKGTLAYMPRETLQNCVYSKQGDVFALGILVNEVLTGYSPFEGVSPILLPYQISCGKRPRVIMLRESDGVSYDLLQCILTCWSDDVGSRLTAEAVCSTVSRCLHVSGGDPRNKGQSSEYVIEEPIEINPELYACPVAATVGGATSSGSFTAAASGTPSLSAPPKPPKQSGIAPQASTASSAVPSKSRMRHRILEYLNPFRRLNQYVEEARIAREQADIAAEEKARSAIEEVRIAAEEKARIAAEKTVKGLIAAGKNNETKNEFGLTHLHDAVYESEARLLILHGANVNAITKDNVTPLHCAADRGNEAAVRLLIASGADVLAKNIHGRTPLHIAARGGHEAVATLLIASGVSVSDAPAGYCTNDGNTPLHYAASGGHEAVVRLLIASGADVLAKNIKGVTPFTAAGKYTSIADLLAEECIKKVDVERMKENKVSK